MNISFDVRPISDRGNVAEAFRESSFRQGEFSLLFSHIECDELTFTEILQTPAEGIEEGDADVGSEVRFIQHSGSADRVDERFLGVHLRINFIKNVEVVSIFKDQFLFVGIKLSLLCSCFDGALSQFQDHRVSA